MDTRVIKLDNNLVYSIIYTVAINDDRYLFLVNVDDEKDIKIRKIVMRNSVEYLEYLEDNEEFEKVMLEFKSSFNKKEKIENEE